MLLFFFFSRSKGDHIHHYPLGLFYLTYSECYIKAFVWVIILIYFSCLLQCGCNPGEIGIISPYRKQCHLLQSMGMSKDVEVNTIDKYQGRDKNVIIVSFTLQQQQVQLNIFWRLNFLLWNCLFLPFKLNRLYRISCFILDHHSTYADLINRSKGKSFLMCSKSPNTWTEDTWPLLP